MNLKLVALMAVPLLGVRLAHTSDPSLWMATVLWLCAGVAILLWTRMLRRGGIPVHGAVLVAAGALSNGLVLLANGGIMPVHGMSPDADGGVWRSAEHGGHLLFLADRMSLGGSSPGDLLVLAGMLFTIGAMIARGTWKRRRAIAA
jgi:hypothetical protein